MTQTPDPAAKPAPAKPTPPPRRGEVVDHPAAQKLAARRAFPRWRHRAAALSFLLAVVAPALGATGYLYLRAADQYASTVAFSVRSGETQIPTGILGALAQNVSAAGADAEIVYEFARSQQMVEAAMAALPLEAMYNRPEGDPVFTLGADQPIEDVVDYWNRMTDVTFDAATGLVRFEARAFTPGDARAIAAFALEESTRIVNELSEQARGDAISVARDAVAEAEDRLRAARRAMRAFRDREQDVDPTENARAALGLVAELEQKLAEARVALDSELQLVGPRSPRLGAMRQRVASLGKQIADERARMGAGAETPAADDRRMSGVISDYEELAVDLEFAERAYVSALAAFEQAQIEARRQSRFLAPHIDPTLSVEAQYPQRAMFSLAAFGLLAAAWAILLLIAYNIRDRR